ncbi:MAG: hypothetical protein HRT73_04685 [Flavobacteriales bacterium]|nr:hypothetical protein [Flavobacteriales bacterium]
MDLYKKEFGVQFELGFDLAKYDWLTDKSWHNDVCPSFTYKTSVGYFILWVDYIDPEQREFEQCRYTVISAINEGDEDSPEIFSFNESETIFESESVADLIELFGSIQA